MMRCVRGFSTLELLLVLALLALLVGLFVGNYDAIQRSLSGPEAPEVMLTRVLKEARRLASVTDANVYIKNDPDTAMVKIAGGDGKVLVHFDFAPSGVAHVQFAVLVEKGFNTKKFVAGVPTEKVAVSPDGTASRAVVTIHFSDGTRRNYASDTFTNYLTLYE